MVVEGLYWGDSLGEIQAGHNLYVVGQNSHSVNRSGQEKEKMGQFKLPIYQHLVDSLRFQLLDFFLFKEPVKKYYVLKMVFI